MMLGYRPESSIAEKLQAMVVRDVLNSRMKDFADLWYLSRHFDFATAPHWPTPSLARSSDAIRPFQQGPLH